MPNKIYVLKRLIPIILFANFEVERTKKNKMYF